MSLSSVSWMKGLASPVSGSRKRSTIASSVVVSSCEAGVRVLLRQRAQERRDRQLALAIDADRDLALLVDLELEPAAAGRHQVRREDLLGRVLRREQVGARRAHELRDDHALGAVDDEGAPLGHAREVAHEDALLADLARRLVDEADGHVQRGLVGLILLAALVDVELGGVELVVAELHGEAAGVVLDRGDVVDRLPQSVLHEATEAGYLNVDQVGDVDNPFETGVRPALARGRSGERCHEDGSLLGGSRRRKENADASGSRNARRRGRTARERAAYQTGRVILKPRAEPGEPAGQRRPVALLNVPEDIADRQGPSPARGFVNAAMNCAL